MNKIEKAVDFLKTEIRTSLTSNDSFVRSIPDIDVTRIAEFYRSLNADDRESLLDYFAQCGIAYHCWIIGVDSYDNTQAPSFNQWKDHPKRLEGKSYNSAKDLRGIVGDYKIAKYHGRETYITKELFDYASTISVPKAPEIRKKVKAAMQRLGCHKIEKEGGGDYTYHCKVGEKEFEVVIDYGGWYQLRYDVHLPRLQSPVPYSKLSVEKILGLSFGGWDNITIQTLESSVNTLIAAIEYSVDFPDRLKSVVLSGR